MKFTDSNDNSTLSKPDNNSKNSESLITYDVELKVDLNNKEEGQITRYPIWQRKRPFFFFLVENVKFSGVNYCCILHMIPTNYSEAINSPDLKRWILAMRKEFDSLVENNTFELQKASKNKDIIGSRCIK